MAQKTFNQTLEQLRYGTLHDDLTDSLTRLTEAVTRTNKTGVMTLTIKLKPTNNAGQIEVIDDVKLKLPEENRGTSIMFATPENNLQREDPRQMSIDGLRTVDKQSGELKRIAQ